MLLFVEKLQAAGAVNRVKQPAKKTAAPKAKTVAKPASHPAHAKAKAAPSNAQLQQEITKLQSEVTTLKHSEAKKAKSQKSTKHTAKRQLSPGATVACCSAVALAATLRLQGHRVDYSDVLALYWATARNPDEGASVLATIQAASEHGLAGVRPRWFGPVQPRELAWPADHRGGGGIADAGADVGGEVVPCSGERDVLAAVGAGHGRHRSGPQYVPADDRIHALPLNREFDPADFTLPVICGGASLIFGVELPGGPHALTLDPSGAVWSWDDLYRLEDLTPGPVEEAWAVTWA